MWPVISCVTWKSNFFIIIIVIISCTLNTFLFLNHANENAALSTKQSSVLRVIIQLAWQQKRLASASWDILKEKTFHKLYFF